TPIPRVVSRLLPLSSPPPPRVLLSFPPRRSSDLAPVAVVLAQPVPVLIMISASPGTGSAIWLLAVVAATALADALALRVFAPVRSEEHTSELQSRFDLVCRLLLEKKKSENQPESA